MAQNRYISTNFWKDNYVVELDPAEKLLFIYFLTNPKTNIAGIYEINLREVAFDTGFDIEMIRKIIDRFDRDGKMFYRRGYLVLRNWVKHQSLNPSVKKGIIRAYKTLPDWMKEFVITDTDHELPYISYDSLYTASSEAPTYTNLTKLNLTKPNGTNELQLAMAEVATVEKKTRTNPKEIDGMFSYWKTHVGYEVTANVKKNREYCSKMLKEHSKQEIAEAIQTVGLASRDKFAPRVGNFIDLYYQWDRLKLWIAKSGSTRNGKVAKI